MISDSSLEKMKHLFINVNVHEMHENMKHVHNYKEQTFLQLLMGTNNLCSWIAAIFNYTTAWLNYSI